MNHPVALNLQRSVNHSIVLRTMLVKALKWLRDSYAVYRQRRDLLALDDAMLKDIGISRADALQEGNKPFWRRQN